MMPVKSFCQYPYPAGTLFCILFWLLLPAAYQPVPGKKPDLRGFHPVA